MSSNNNIPQLRFPGFTGEWEEKEIEELCNPISARVKLQSNDYLSEGRYPVVDQSQSMICGWTNNDNGLMLNHPYIIFGDHTCALKYVDFPFIQGADGVKILSPQKEYDPRFVYYTIESNPVNQDGYKRHYSDLKEKIFSLPCNIKEQHKIADCLSEIDNLIAAQGQKVEALKEKKRGMMQQMFPQQGETTPRLRFPEFSGEWNETPLGKVADKEINKNRKLEVSRVLTNSANLGVVDQNEYFDREIAVKDNTNNYYIVEINDFVYNPRISTTAPVGPISINKLGKGIMSPLYTIFRFHTGYIFFYEQYFQTTIWHSYLKSIANFGARFDRMNITTEGFFNMPLLIPSSEEQKKIAECLSAMDEMIASESAKLDALKEHKKGLMQQLFPQPSK